MGYFGGCIYISRERVGLSSRSRFPAFVFCFMSCFMLSYFCLACVSLFSSISFFFVDLLKSTLWSNLQAVVPSDDHQLRALSDSLPDVTLAGRASSTTTKYVETYARWKRWARDHDLPAFPVSPYHFALYLRHQDRFPHRVRRSWHCLGSPFNLAGERSPSEHPLVKDVLAGAQRRLAHRTSRN